MANLIPGSDLSAFRHCWVERWHEWEEDLDRLERFASTLGGTYGQRMDIGSIALASALVGLFALAW